VWISFFWMHWTFLCCRITFLPIQTELIFSCRSQ
jgi:hypothetical protein